MAELGTGAQAPRHGEPGVLSDAEADAFIAVLQQRFDTHMHRHPGVAWAAVRARLQAGGAALWSLHAMERTGGEPDVLGAADADGAFLFCDCAAESPAGRRSLCYDEDALASRKEHPPQGSAVDRARAMGAALLTEAQYRQLQQAEPLDGKTSSWLDTRPTSGGWAARCSATGATAGSSRTTTVRSPTTPRAGSGRR